MGIVRPVMEVHPWAWCFFVPFIIVATFTILNLFIGIIVSTMQELALLSTGEDSRQESLETLHRIEADLAVLKRQLTNSNETAAKPESPAGKKSLSEGER